MQIVLTWLQAARTQQQRASVFRAGLSAGASRRQATAQRSGIARLQATAQKRLAPPQLFLAPSMTIGQAPRQAQKVRSRQPRSVSRKSIRQPVRLWAAGRRPQLAQIRTQRASAQLARSRAQRASILAQRRGQVTETSAAAAHTAAKAAEAPASAAQPGKAACTRTAAHKRHALASSLSALASGTQQALRGALDRFSRQPRVAAGKVATTPEKLRAAGRHAHQMQSSAQRDSGLLLRRNHNTVNAPSAAEDGPASGTHSSTSPSSQQGPMQVI